MLSSRTRDIAAYIGGGIGVVAQFGPLIYSIVFGYWPVWIRVYTAVWILIELGLAWHRVHLKVEHDHVVHSAVRDALQQNRDAQVP